MKFHYSSAPRSARSVGRIGRGALALLLCLPWLVVESFSQSLPTLPLSLDQSAFFYRTFPVYRTNTAPLINWQSKKGVPISTNALDAGSDGRAPTLAQQIALGTNYPTASPSPGQFRGVVNFGAVAVQKTSVLDTNKSFAQNVVALNWPRLESSPGQVSAVLRASQVGAPYLNKLTAFPFGSVIPTPLTDERGVSLTNNPNYWLASPMATSTNLGYYFSPYANVVFATQPGQVTIVWEKSVPTSTQPTNLPASVGTILQGGNWYLLYTNLYLVSGEAVKTPQKMYWTEGVRASLGYRVEIPSGITANIIYNSSLPQNVPAPGDTASGVDPSHATSTLWVDTVGNVIKADNAKGRAFVELIGARNADGIQPFLGFEIVDVYSDPVPVDINVALGTRIPAYQDGRDDSQLIVVPPQTQTQFYYRQTIPNTANFTLYAVRETSNVNDFAAYWLNTGTAGLKWPYLFNRYHEYWPTAPSDYVNYVRPLVPTDALAATTAVQLPSADAPSIAYQDDPNNPRAFLTSSGSFHTFLDPSFPAHRTLLQYLSGNKVFYQRVFSWLDAGLKTNSLFAGTVATNLTSWNSTNLALNFPDPGVVPYVITNTVNVGERIVAPAGEAGAAGTNFLAGYIIQTNGDSFNPAAYLDPFAVGFDLANQGAIIPVNAIPGKSSLEVIWFRPDHPAIGFQSSYWPAVIGHYNLRWPTSAPEIILADNNGSGLLNNLQASGSIYRQPNPTQPGFNPNEEHAVLLGGRAYALRDDLNNTNAAAYSSDPFVLISYAGSDGRPAMATYHVRREAPEKGIVFDYVVDAGTILQAPMPLPLLAPPVEGAGAAAINYNTAPPTSSGDQPIGFTNLPTNSPLTYYGGFVFEDRKREFWVYRGFNSGLPDLQAGAYNPTSNSFAPLPAATAVLNQPFAYSIQLSRRPDSITMTASNLPAGLAIVLNTNGSGFAIAGIPNSVGSNFCTVTAQDLADGTLVSRTLALNVVSNGAVVALAPLTITSTNQYSAQTVTYSNRPPFLALAPTVTNSFTMRFYYKNQPQFDWPGQNDPGAGAIVPYLLPKNSAADPTSKNTASLDIVYRPVWPSLVNSQPLPTLQSGQTLTVAANNLAAVRGQSSVQVLYQQSLATNDINGANRSVILFDPTVQKTSSLAAQNLSGLPVGINATLYQGRSYFQNLPPNLVNRVYYDPETGSLTLNGEFVSQAVGENYLLLNVLAGADLAAVVGLCPTNDMNYTNWIAVVTNLATPLYTFHEDPVTPGSYVIDPNQTHSRFVSDLVELTSSEQQVDSYALSATGPGRGYITYITGNSSNPAHAGEPVSVHIAQVSAPLHAGQLVVIQDPNPLSESISFQHTVDLAGRSANYQYDWRISPPVGGQPPTSDPASWPQLTAVANDVSHFTLGGAGGLQSLSDNFVALRYRETDALASPANTNWSGWTTPVLAEGFIKRVLAGVNPFNQRVGDLFNNSVNTTASIISQAGHRWEGDVALNSSTITNVGLIEIYETLLRRGESLSINAGFNYGPANDALLLAAGYLSDLYSLIANDALADASNPTIGIGTADKTYGNVATALYAFQGQEASLSEEELALLRGRNDALSPGVQLAPVYNKLYWNYTRGIASGEVIYALNYNILDQNHDGVVNAADAAILYPMGHGDAYGHYLTALNNYYGLLMNPNFDWVPQIETVSVLGAPVSVGYQHERKFAAAAAALANTGLRVFDLTWRQNYHAGTSGGWNYFDPTDVNLQRTYTKGGTTNYVTGYWGLDHWASRTAQGAYLNWVVGNAILPPVDPDPNHQGIQKIDRTTVAELNQLPRTAAQLQAEMNNAEAGFTPFNLSQNAVAFDIDPLQVTGANPQTHFDQVYQRAVSTLNNAVRAFNDAQNVTQLMRSEEDSLSGLQAGVVAQELAYNNQLIELYGTPYLDDMGPGKTYPQGYDGPDLLHYTYVETPDTDSFNGSLADPTITNVYYVDVQQFPLDWATNMYDNFNFILQSTAPGYNGSNGISVPLVIGPDGFFDKPTNWNSQRSSPGQIQAAISRLIAAKHALRTQISANALYDKSVLDKDMEAFKANLASSLYQASLGNTNLLLQNQINNINLGYNIANAWIEYGAGIADDLVTIVGDTAPDSFLDVLKELHTPILASIYGVKWAALGINTAAFTGTQVQLTALQNTINNNAIAIANSQLDNDTKNAILNLGAELAQVQGDLIGVSKDFRDLTDAQEAYQALVAKGRRIQSDRLNYRQHAAALVQGYRTRDAAFRLFQNEKLQRYLTLYDLAAKYAYLAAQAYDYETGLLGTSQGQDFLRQIIAAQALGVVVNGQPQYSNPASGDPGLAGALAQMKGDWDVVKSRLGFNNPDGYGTTVSLRSENFRILANTNGDNAWKQVLQQSRVADLRADTDVMRHCLQIDDGSGLPVPGIVLSFSTVVANGQNLFGNLLSAGDHNFSPSSFATKIFATGVCLDGYIGMDNPSPGGGITPPDPTLDPNALAATPYVYLIPVGQDSMRSPPLGDANAVRSWDVDDVAVPLPFNISAADFSSTPFYTSANSLSEPLFAMRKHQAFRPVSTTSVFTRSIYGANGSLQPTEYANKRLIGRSVWNSQWKLVIPGRTLLSDPNQGLDRFIQSVKDIHLYLITYSYAGN